MHALGLVSQRHEEPQERRILFLLAMLLFLLCQFKTIPGKRKKRRWACLGDDPDISFHYILLELHLWRVIFG